MSELINKMRSWSYHRQLLGKQGDSVAQVLRGIVGVYSAHPSAPLSLYARLNSFAEQTFYSLDDDKLALRVPAMRQSVYCLPPDTAHRIMAATVPPRADPSWQKRYGQKGRYISPEHYQGYIDTLLGLLATPMTATEIKKVVDIPAEMLKPVLNRMAFERYLVRVGAKSLRSNIISYVATEAWTGQPVEPIGADEALTWLAGEYLRAFGPARDKDFQWWTGVTATKAKQAVATHQTTAIADDYLLLTEDVPTFESFTATLTDRLDILPQWDSYTMGYAPDGRARFVNSEMQSHIYGALGATGGNALGVVLVNGLAHGSWKHRFAGSQMKIALTMFETPTPALQQAIESQFDEIATLLQAKRVVLDMEVV